MATRGMSRSMSRRGRKAAALSVKIDGARDVRVTGDFTGRDLVRFIHAFPTVHTVDPVVVNGSG